MFPTCFLGNHGLCWYYKLTQHETNNGDNMSETEAIKKSLPLDELKKMRGDVEKAQLEKATFLVDFLKGQVKLKSEVVVTAPTKFSIIVDENDEVDYAFSTDLKFSFAPKIAIDMEEEVNRNIFGMMFKDLLEKVGQ